MGESIKNVEFSKEVPLGFEVIDLDYVHARPSYFRGVRIARFYQVVWIESGEAICTVDFEQVRVGAGQMLVIAPDRSYIFDTESAYTGRLIIFTRLFLEQTTVDEEFVRSSVLLNTILKNPVVDINQELMRHYLALLEAEAGKNACTIHQRIIQGLLMVLLMNAERTVREQDESLPSHFSRPTRCQFSNDVEQFFRSERSVEFYCRRLGMTDKTLKKTIEKHIGKSPKQYINDRVILEAKRLLCYNDISVKEIAYELGFSDDSNFYKFFFKHTGLTPLAFRKIYR